MFELRSWVINFVLMLQLPGYFVHKYELEWTERIRGHFDLTFWTRDSCLCPQLNIFISSDNSFTIFWSFFVFKLRARSFYACPWRSVGLSVSGKMSKIVKSLWILTTFENKSYRSYWVDPVNIFRPCVCPFVCPYVGLNKNIATKKRILEYSRVVC